MGASVTRRLGSAAAIVAAVLVFAAPAGAATFEVDRTADAAATGSTSDGSCAAAGGGCTLRAAVQEANDTAGADAIVLPAGGYGLSLASAIEITSSLTLSGEGARTTVVDAGGDSRVFRVTGGTVGISGIAIEGGTGGVQVEGAGTELTLDRVAVSGNTIHANGASGGGINLTDGELTVRDSTISGNSAEDSGGSQALGGGVNALSVASGLTLENVTIAGNRATSAGTSSGGGLANATAATLRHVTFSGNATSTSGHGGNLFASPAASTTLADSIVAAGSAGTGANCDGRSPVKQGRNLATDSSCALPASSIVGPAGLAALGDHGGPTDTLPPLPASRAVDAAAACPASGYDQRGQLAPAGSACDLGAAELGADLSASLTPSAASVPSRGSLTYVAAVRNGGLDPAEATLTFTRPPAATLTFVNSATGSCSGIGPITCDFGDLAPGAAASATITVTAPAGGEMVATARASGPVPDPDRSNDLATETTPVLAPPPPGPDTTPPVLTGLLLVEPMHPRRGGMLRYTLSEDATLTLRLYRRLPGHRAGGRCSASARGRKCTRLVRAGTQRLRGRAGAATAQLAARWSGHRPKPGRYRITITAVDAAGNRSGPRSISARVSP